MEILALIGTGFLVALVMIAGISLINFFIGYGDSKRAMESRIIYLERRADEQFQRISHLYEALTPKKEAKTP